MGLVIFNFCEVGLSVFVFGSAAGLFGSAFLPLCPNVLSPLVKAMNLLSWLSYKSSPSKASITAASPLIAFLRERPSKSLLEARTFSIADFKSPVILAVFFPVKVTFLLTKVAVGNLSTFKKSALFK